MDNITILNTYLSDINKYNTDKNTIHSYIEKLYNQLFDDNTKIFNILEIGAFNGGSALLWRDFFINANVDIIDINQCDTILNEDRINHIVGDAYSSNIVNMLRNKKYDIIIDDGPHTLESMKFFVQNYVYLLNFNGIAIIEDIQDYSWFQELVPIIPKNFINQTIDLRNVKNRYDDLLLIVKHK